MSHPTLQRRDAGEDVIRLQSQLNKVGAMLVADGDFGPGTERGVAYAQDMAGLTVTGIADDILWQWLETQPEPFPQLGTEGVAFIAREETGGLAYYDSVTCWPHYPGHASGITIGTGYDLRFNSEADFRASWGDWLPPAHIDELARDIGLKGSKARADELKSLGIQVPFKAAWPVFTTLTLPRFYGETAGIYPLLEQLPGLCRSALVSLVFNRGTSLSGSARSEMKTIQGILAEAGDAGMALDQRKAALQGVEEQILSMKRLWAPGSGLIKRRQAEANLWRQGLNSW